MSFEDDARWDEVIALMNYLSLATYTGNFKFQLVDGRVSRRTVEDLRIAVALVKSSERHRREFAHA